MQLTVKGAEALSKLKKRYGTKRGARLFLALIDVGKLKAAEMYG